MPGTVQKHDGASVASSLPRYSAPKSPPHIVEPAATRFKPSKPASSLLSSLPLLLSSLWLLFQAHVMAPLRSLRWADLQSEPRFYVACALLSFVFAWLLAVPFRLTLIVVSLASSFLCVVAGGLCWLGRYGLARLLPGGVVRVLREMSLLELAQWAWSSSAWLDVLSVLVFPPHDQAELHEALQRLPEEAREAILRRGLVTFAPPAFQRLFDPSLVQNRSQRPSASSSSSSSSFSSSLSSVSSSLAVPGEVHCLSCFTQRISLSSRPSSRSRASFSSLASVPSSSPSPSSHSHQHQQHQHPSPRSSPCSSPSSSPASSPSSSPSLSLRCVPPASTTYTTDGPFSPSSLVSSTIVSSPSSSSSSSRFAHSSSSSLPLASTATSITNTASLSALPSLPSVSLPALPSGVEHKVAVKVDVKSSKGDKGDKGDKGKAGSKDTSLVSMTRRFVFWKLADRRFREALTRFFTSHAVKYAAKSVSSAALPAVLASAPLPLPLSASLSRAFPPNKRTLRLLGITSASTMAVQLFFSRGTRRLAKRWAVLSVEFAMYVVVTVALAHAVASRTKPAANDDDDDDSEQQGQHDERKRRDSSGDQPSPLSASSSSSSPSSSSSSSSTSSSSGLLSLIRRGVPSRGALLTSLFVALWLLYLSRGRSSLRSLRSLSASLSPALRSRLAAVHARLPPSLRALPPPLLRYLAAVSRLPSRLTSALSPPAIAATPLPLPPLPPLPTPTNMT